jgi:hypothetical protein
VLLYIIAPIQSNPIHLALPTIQVVSLPSSIMWKQKSSSWLRIRIELLWLDSATRDSRIDTHIYHRFPQQYLYYETPESNFIPDSEHRSPSFFRSRQRQYQRSALYHHPYTLRQNSASWIAGFTATTVKSLPPYHQHWLTIQEKATNPDSLRLPHSTLLSNWKTPRDP